ncbi:MAG: TonB-dependent receptor [Oceanicaulis sp.]|nr:TonB-dependent receptor [Oceanicaulis sp.]
MTGEESWTEPTWRLAADWRPNDNILAYASYDRGYKSGLYPSQAQNAVQASTPLDPEILDNFEIGLKTNWNNGRFILNGSAFFTDYQDLQVYELLGLALVTSNADAEIFGVEIETQARLTDNFMVGGTYAYLDAEYVSDAQSAIGVLPYNGNQLTRARRTSTPCSLSSMRRSDPAMRVCGRTISIRASTSSIRRTIPKCWWILTRPSTRGCPGSPMTSDGKSRFGRRISVTRPTRFISSRTTGSALTCSRRRAHGARACVFASAADPRSV